METTTLNEKYIRDTKGREEDDGKRRVGLGGIVVHDDREGTSVVSSKGSFLWFLFSTALFLYKEEGERLL